MLTTFPRGLARLAALLLLAAHAGCAGAPSRDALLAVDYAPRAEGPWPVSTPAEQALDPLLVARLYYDAARLPTTYSVLVFKDGALIAEDYFHGGSPTQQVNVHSVTKSITGALVGIALEQGCLTSLDQRMVEFFPDVALTDPRKRTITLRQMLQMRAGYPWEESSEELINLLFTGFHTSTLEQVPLVREPGADFDYSNLTSHLLGIIVARACGTDLKTFAEQHLFGPLGITPGFWQQDWDGNYLGFSDISLSARDLAAFGLMALDHGSYRGTQVVPAAWVETSRQVYSTNAWTIGVGRNWQDNGYGFQWWSVRAGPHRYSLAWGHGGQQIALLDDLQMVIVVLADPLHLKHGGGPWKIEKGNLNLVADFVASLPGG